MDGWTGPRPVRAELVAVDDNGDDPLIRNAPCPHQITRYTDHGTPYQSACTRRGHHPRHADQLGEWT